MWFQVTGTHCNLQCAHGPYTMESPACYTCRTAGLTCKNEYLEAKDIVRESVNEFYATAAIQPQKELFMKGFLEEIPLADECVDLVTSNCVINLSAQKEKVFQEIFRILKTGGRFVISDIVSDREVPVSMKRDKILWSECISGAVTEKEFFNITLVSTAWK